MRAREEGAEQPRSLTARQPPLPSRPRVVGRARCHADPHPWLEQVLRGTQGLQGLLVRVEVPPLAAEKDECLRGRDRRGNRHDAAVQVGRSLADRPGFRLPGLRRCSIGEVDQRTAAQRARRGPQYRVRRTVVQQADKCQRAGEDRLLYRIGAPGTTCHQLIGLGRAAVPYGRGMSRGDRAPASARPISPRPMTVTAVVPTGDSSSGAVRSDALPSPSGRSRGSNKYALQSGWLPTGAYGRGRREAPRLELDWSGPRRQHHRQFLLTCASELSADLADAMAEDPAEFGDELGP